MAHLHSTITSMAFALAVLLLGTQTTLAAERNLNLELDQEALKLAWTFDTGKAFNIVPTVGNGKVYAIAVGGVLNAFNPKTGHVDWTYDPKEGLWDRSLTVDGDQLFVCYKGGKFAALNASDGAVQWETDIGINCQRPHHVDGDTVYVSTTFVGPGLPGDPLTGAKLFAINRHNGHIKWELKTEEYLLQTATSRDGTIFLAGNYIDTSHEDTEGGPAHYYAVDQETGKIKWTYKSEDGTPKLLIATEQNLLFSAYNDFIQALDKNTGELLWKRDSNNWLPGFSVDDKNIYLSSATTIVHSWPINGEGENWRFNIPGKKFDYLLTKPTLVNERIYFMSQRGYVYALNKATGKQIFRYESGMNSRVGLTYSDGYVYMNDSKGRVYGYKIMK